MLRLTIFSLGAPGGSLGKKPPTGQPSAFFQDHAQQAPLITRKINKLQERHLGKWNKLLSV